jgi:murein DD-endopeptidase MepM/ murein hydrolase activator NlpD
VELRHPQGIRTRYAHLKSIASDVRLGAHVDQGQIIGRVGSSGLATGPHLHYEFIQNGRHRNPQTVELPGAPSVASTHLTEFLRTRDEALALLEGISVHDAMWIAANTHTAAERPAVSPAQGEFQHPPPRIVQL